MKFLNQRFFGEHSVAAANEIKLIAPRTVIARPRARGCMFQGILLVLSLLPSLAFALSPSDMVILDEFGVRNLGLQSVEVDYREFESTVFAIGRIEEIPATRSVLSTRIAGRVTELNAFEGDMVRKGDVLVKVESRQLGDPPPVIELKALQDGLVVASHVRLGQPVAPDVEMMDVADRSKMWAIAQIPEREAAQVKIGQRAHIAIPSLGGVPIEAKLVRFGVEADRQAGTVAAIFEIENPAGKLRPGMRAEFSVVLSTRDDVIAVPVEAVQGDPSKRFVFVKDFDLPNAFVRAPVVLGERNDAWVEVLSGLFPSDEVVTRGSYMLGFAAGGSGISLKEALDAAHGHEHNEDGSEMTAEQRASRAKERVAKHAEAHGGHGQDELSPALLAYAVVMSILALVFLQLFWSQKRRQSAEG